MNDQTEAEVISMLAEVWREVQRLDVIWQLALIAACLGIGWLVSQRVQTWFDRKRAADTFRERAIGMGVGALHRISWPLIAMLALLAARPVFAQFHSFGLVNLAIALLGWLVVVRAVLYGLRAALPGSTFLLAFERTIATVIWVSFALHVTGLFGDFAGFFESIKLPVGKQTISLWTVMTAAVWVFFTILVALWIGTAIERKLMGAESLNRSLRVALSRLTRAALVFVAILLSLNLVGIDLTVLSIFGGAFGVGLGFGLQKIASNYTSGFIVLFDRSVRIGDVISIDNFNGEVRDITTRYTLIRALDGREAIVPNEKLITETVLNHSFSDRQVRVAVAIQVAYSTDVERVLRLLEEVATQHERVVDTPPATAVLLGFAENGINLEVGFWIRDPENGTGRVRSDVGLALWKAFKAEGIQIPFPQREVRVVPPAELIQVTRHTDRSVNEPSIPVESVVSENWSKP